MRFFALSGLVAVAGIYSSSALAQNLNCPGKWINNYCVCWNGQTAGWNYHHGYLCAPEPAPQYHAPAAPQSNWTPGRKLEPWEREHSAYDRGLNRAFELFERGGAGLMSRQPPRQNIPLSSGTVSQPPGVPMESSTGYQDPFASQRAANPTNRPYDPSANNCGPNMRAVARGGTIYCELYMERSPN
jgi:hypothetical protein